MNMIDNDTIAEMMGGKPKGKKQPQQQSNDWESQVINGFKNNNSPSNNQQPQQNNWETNLISGFKNKASQPNKSNTKVPTQQDPMNPTLSGSGVEDIGNKLKNVPPFMIIGIVLFVIPFFKSSIWIIPLGFLSPLGMICIMYAIVDKAIPKENKEKAKYKIKMWWIKYKLKQLQKQLVKEEKNGRQ